MLNKTLQTVLFAAATAAALSAHATSTINGTVGVNLTIAQGCSVNSQSQSAPAGNGNLVSWGTLDFGSQPNLSSDRIATLGSGQNPIVITCNDDNRTPSMKINGGLYKDKDDDLRMRSESTHGSGAHWYIHYKLYSDHALQNSLTPEQDYPLQVVNGTVDISLYAAIKTVDNEDKNPPPSIYSDQVTVMLSW